MNTQNKKENPYSKEQNILINERTIFKSKFERRHLSENTAFRKKNNFLIQGISYT